MSPAETTAGLPTNSDLRLDLLPSTRGRQIKYAHQEGPPDVGSNSPSERQGCTCRTRAALLLPRRSRICPDESPDTSGHPPYGGGRRAGVGWQRTSAFISAFTGAILHGNINYRILQRTQSRLVAGYSSTSNLEVSTISNNQHLWMGICCLPTSKEREFGICGR